MPIPTAAAIAMRLTDRPCCPACNGHDWSIRFRDLSDRLYGSPGTFEIWECTKCSVLSLRPLPADERLCYPPEYYAYSDHERGHCSTAAQLRRRAADVALPRLWRATFVPIPGLRSASMSALKHRTVADELRLYSHAWSRSLLDIGCGSGQFLIGARRLGFAASGLELNPHAVATARLAGIECAQGRVETLCADARTYDIIRMSHVLEHLRDPVSVLQCVRERLAPGGVLALIVPNARGVIARLFAEDWFQLDPPRHLWGFGADNLVHMLDRAGLAAAGVWHRSSPRLIYFSFAYQLLGEHGGVGPAEPTHEAFRTCAELAHRLDAASQGDTIVVVARAREVV